MIHSLKTEQFDEFMQNNELVFVVFWTDKCDSCEQFSTMFQQIARLNKTIKFAKVNITEEIELGEIFHLHSVPHLMIFKQSIIIYSELGIAIPESTLAMLVQQALSVDVSEIREQATKEYNNETKYRHKKQRK